MRRKLVQSDLVDCVIGLGPNLFFNAPMEACIVICRTGKPAEKKQKILFINALKEVTRKNAQSYLEDAHIQHIVSAYNNYVDEADYSKLATTDDVEKNDFSLNIPLYVRSDVIETPVYSVQECVDDWLVQKMEVQSAVQTLLDLLPEEE